MKRFSVADRHKPLDRKTASSCLIVNQFATPGLGSLLARRFIAGTGQLILSITGFCLVILWFFSVLRSTYQDVFGGAPVAAHNEYGEYGALIFLASWAWSWVTSLSLMREAKRNETSPSVPPKL